MDVDGTESKAKHTEEMQNTNTASNDTKITTLCPVKSIKTESYVKKNVKNLLQLDQSHFESLTREQLVDEVIRLERHVNQLKNLLNKTNTTEEYEGKSKRKKRYKERPFDFNKYNKRHILLKFLYLGWDYKGYIVQEHTKNTIESHLFEALRITKLVEERESSNYNRCGRTDNGVSAFSQVISIDVRSNCKSGVGVIVNEKSQVTNDDIENEINYAKLLNGALPDNIRVICWSPIESDVSARFDCTGRIYRYYFPKGDLDIDAINEAGKRMIGQHDFRNFCKMDVGNGVITFFRRLENVTCQVIDDKNDEYATCELIIEGSSFLWHQIRCIVALLFLVGQKKEDPSIITELFDVEKHPCKPQYTMSSEIPLVLFDCQYNIVKNWIYDHLETEKVIKTMQDSWVVENTKATIAKRMTDYLTTQFEESKKTYVETGKNKEKRKNLAQTYLHLQGYYQGYMTNYVKLTDRLKSSSLESRIDHYVKRRRLDDKIYDKLEDNKKLANKLDLYKNERNYDSTEKPEDSKNTE